MPRTIAVGRTIAVARNLAAARVIRSQPFLYDQFNTALAAGSVNGTPAEPGPGVRVVTDTGNLVSISSGRLQVAGRTVTNSDPRIMYLAIPRTLGRTFLVSVRQGGTTTSNRVGWSTTGANSPSEMALGFANTDLSMFDNNTTIAVAAVAINTWYRIALTMRTAGSFQFIRGGAFTYWTLVWIGSASVAANPVPGAGTGNNNGTWILDDPYAPRTVYIPEPLAYDTFTRANGALGNSETTGPDGQSVTGRAWTDQIGTWAILSNAASASSLSGGIALATLDAGKSDVILDTAFTRSAGEGGLVARYADSSNYLKAYHDGTNAVCVQIVAGVPTTLRTAVVTYVAGRILRLVLDGTTGRLFYGNAVVGAVFTVPSSSAIVHGLYTTNTGNSLDNFTVWARGTGDEYSGLNAL